jgi:1-acyl-sn-glycerol-3-phosphate acyltransferase
MPKAIAYIIVFPISFFVSWLLNAMKAIPVYRGKRDIILSFRQSVNALVSGESLIISPDINYTDTGSDMGEMYDGFLCIDKYFYKETNKHIAFVPIYIDKSAHSIYIGNSIYFTRSNFFKAERKELAEKIQCELQRLQKLSSSH